jgi:CcmD family protein
MPALPLHEAGKYVAAAYIVFFVLVLVYVSIMALRLSRIERELGELLTIAEQPPADDAGQLDEADEQDAPQEAGVS